MKDTRIEAGDDVNTALFRQDCLPKSINAGADARDGSDTGNHGASPSLLRCAVGR
jgi:hypothetical protein